MQNKSSTYFKEYNKLDPKYRNPNVYSKARYRQTYVQPPSKDYKLGSPTITRFKTKDKNEK